MNLRDVAAGARFCCGSRHFERIILSNEIDRSRGQILLDNFGGISAVEIGHCDIEQNDVWIESERFLHGVLSISRLTAYAPAFMSFQKQFQSGPNHGRILRNENSQHCDTSEKAEEAARSRRKKA